MYQLSLLATEFHLIAFASISGLVIQVLSLLAACSFHQFGSVRFGGAIGIIFVVSVVVGGPFMRPSNIIDRRKKISGIGRFFAFRCFGAREPGGSRDETDNDEVSFTLISTDLQFACS